MRQIFAALLLAGAGIVLPATVTPAQETYPTQPILLTHGNTAGSSSDLMARIIAEPLAARQ